jgi:hypothetical protein
MKDVLCELHLRHTTKFSPGSPVMTARFSTSKAASKETPGMAAWRSWNGKDGDERPVRVV